MLDVILNDPVLSVLAVLGAIIVGIIIWRLADKFSLYDELIALSLHEFDAGEFADAARIKKVVPVGLAHRVEDTLERLAKAGRVQMRTSSSGVKEYRLDPSRRRDVPVPTMGAN
ncbi:MAG TPA: hypothetical protein VGE31_01190 [Candidatus Paceibacterota bacterium]